MLPVINASIADFPRQNVFLIHILLAFFPLRSAHWHVDFIHCFHCIAMHCARFFHLFLSKCVVTFYLFPHFAQLFSSRNCVSFSTSWIQYKNSQKLHFSFIKCGAVAIQTLVCSSSIVCVCSPCLCEGGVCLLFFPSAILFYFLLISLRLFYYLMHNIRVIIILRWRFSFRSVLRCACFAVSVISLIIGFNGCECEWKVSNYK